MVSPLLFLSRMAALRGHLSHVLYPAPTAVEFHTAGVGPLSCRDLCLCPFPSLDHAHGPYRGLVGAAKRVDVCGIYNPARLASYPIPGKEGAWSWQQLLGVNAVLEPGGSVCGRRMLADERHAEIT
jgi:hypothetical protein